MSFFVAEKTCYANWPAGGPFEAFKSDTCQSLEIMWSDCATNCCCEIAFGLDHCHEGKEDTVFSKEIYGICFSHCKKNKH